MNTVKWLLSSLAHRQTWLLKHPGATAAQVALKRQEMAHLKALLA